MVRPLSFRNLLHSALAASMALTLSACFGGLDEATNTYGLSLLKVTGDGQSVYPNQITPQDLTVKVTGSDGFTPVSGIQVSFVEETTLGVEILRPLVETNSMGYAATGVRPPAQRYGETVRIRAMVAGTESQATFSIRVASTEAGTRFLVTTTNGGIEKAGVPFRFFVSVVDDRGREVQEMNQTMALQWTVESASSWAGTAPKVPTLILCQFMGGKCMTEEYTLTDSRAPTRVHMGDGPTGLTDVFSYPITVLPNDPSHVTLANGPGGPANGAKVRTLTDTISVTPDAGPQIFYGAIIDMAGNYIKDATNGDWVVQDEVRFDGNQAPIISGHLSTNVGASTVFTPVETGSGQISLQVSNFSAISRRVIVEPGVPAKISLHLTTQDPTRALPGQWFRVFVHVEDAHGNLQVRSDGISVVNGTFDVTYSLEATFDGENTGSILHSGMLPGQGRSGFHPEQVSGLVERLNRQMVFVNSVATKGPAIILNDATDVNPVLSVKMIYKDTSFKAKLPIAISLGAPYRLNLHRALGDDGKGICQFGSAPDGSTPPGNGCSFSPVNRGTPESPSYNAQAGDTSYELYVAAEDQGGNFLGNVKLTSLSFLDIWSGPFDWIRDDTEVAGKEVTKLIFTPTKAGSGYMSMGAWMDGYYLEYKYKHDVKPGPLNRYELELTDGYNPTNKISATRPYKLVLTPMDALGNELGAISVSPARILDVYYTGATASPKGTPVTKPNPTVSVGSLVSGRIVLEGAGDYRLPNASNTVQIRVEDVTELADTGVKYVSNTVEPQLIPGDAKKLQIRSAVLGGGTDYTNTTLQLTPDAPKTLYATVFDDEMNPIPGAQVIWDYAAFGDSASFTEGLSSLVIDPEHTRSAVLKAKYGTLEAPVTINIVPGDLTYVILSSTDPDIQVGDEFGVELIATDKKGNHKTDIDGAQNVLISVSNATNSPSGVAPAYPWGTASYNFVDGKAMIAGPFKFVNSSETPTIYATIQGKIGNLPVTLSPGPLDRLRIFRPDVSPIFAGNTINFKANAVDAFGNKIGTGPVASAGLNLQIDTLNGGRTISKVNGVGTAGGATVASVLINGEATIEASATGAGQFRLNGSLVGEIPPNSTEFAEVTINPDPVIDSIIFDPSLPGSATHQASATNPLSTFRVLLKDKFSNTITTDNASTIEVSLTSGTRPLIGTAQDKTQTVDAGKALFTNLKYTKAETITLKAREPISGKEVSRDITIIAGSATQTIVRLDGQTFVPGVATLAEAITGTPNAVTACGAAITAHLYAVDDAFNQVDTNAAVSINLKNRSTTDPNASISASGNFVNGYKTFTIAHKKSGTELIVVPTTDFNDVESTPYSAATGASAQFITLLPNETLVPGATSLAAAKSFTAAFTPLAGQEFAIRAQLTDACYNPVTQTGTASLSHTSFGGAAGAIASGEICETWANGCRAFYEAGNKDLTSGLVSFNVKLFQSGSRTVNLAANSLGKIPQASTSFTVNNGPARHFVFNNVPPANVSADTFLDVKATLQDEFNNQVTTGSDASASIILTRTGGDNQLHNGTGYVANKSITASSGVADFSTIVANRMYIREASGTNTVTVTKSGSAVSLTTGNINVVAGNHNKFAVTWVGNPSSVQAGSSQSIQATAQDAWNNTVYNYTGIVTFSSNDAKSGVFPANTQFLLADNGVKIFPITLKTQSAGSWIKVSDAAITSRNGTTPSVIVDPGPAYQLYYSSFPVSSVQAGVCQGITVQMQDEFNNAVTGAVTVNLSETSNGAFYGTNACDAPITQSSIAAGQNSANLWFKNTKAESALLTASSTGVTPAERTITIVPQASSLTLYSDDETANNQTGPVNVDLTKPIKVLIKDAFNNPAPGYTVNFTASHSGSAASKTTAADGIASTTWKLGTTAGTQTLAARAATGPANTVSFSATANPGSASKLIFKTPYPASNRTRGVAFEISPKVQLADQWDNPIASGSYQVNLRARTACTSGVPDGTLTAAPVAMTNGEATFGAVSYNYTPAAAGDPRVIYLEAWTAEGYSGCYPTGLTIYDTLAINPPTFALNASETKTFTVTGGVPSRTASVTTRDSQGAANLTTSSSNSFNFAYTAGAMGSTTDIISVSDAIGTGVTASVTVNGAKLAWDGANDNSWPNTSTDVSHSFTIRNNGNGDSGGLSIGSFTLSNCKKGASTVTCGDHWVVTLDSCGGATPTDPEPILAGQSCTVNVTYRGSQGTAGTYTADLTVAGSPGGTVKVSLTGTKP